MCVSCVVRSKAKRENIFSIVRSASSNHAEFIEIAMLKIVHKCSPFFVHMFFVTSDESGACCAVRMCLSWGLDSGGFSHVFVLRNLTPEQVCDVIWHTFHSRPLYASRRLTIFNLDVGKHFDQNVADKLAAVKWPELATRTCSMNHIAIRLRYQLQEERCRLLPPTRLIHR